jgi:hypothetical protein
MGHRSAIHHSNHLAEYIVINLLQGGFYVYLLVIPCYISLILNIT